MNIIPKQILLVQHLPATGDYVVFREGGVAETHRSGAYDGSEDFHRYVRECTTSGALKEVTLGVPTGLVSGPKTINCKQIIYCKQFDTQHTTAVQKTVEVATQAKTALNKLFAKTNEIVYVRWNPHTYELQVQTGKVPIPSTHRIRSLEEAPPDAFSYMLDCVRDGATCLKRSYNRPISTGGIAKMTLVTEYFFSNSMTHKDFKGNDVDVLSSEDKAALGLA